MFFQIIETSSAGNCAFLSVDGTNILIDAGLTVKKTKSYLKTLGLSTSDIDAVFITHEHIDHRRALPSFAECNTKIFANALTAESICYLDQDTRNLHWRIFETGVPFEFNGIRILPFPIPHDTNEAVGYKFEFGKHNLVWMTDLGSIPDSVKSAAQEADILVLESNYCPVMLEHSKRPYKLKKRIQSRHGHLSNADAIFLLSSLDPSKLIKVYLAHISRECNSIEHIGELLQPLGSMKDIIEIVSPFSASSKPFRE